MKVIFWGALLCSTFAFSNPTQPLVISGNASIQEKGSLLEIIASDQTVIHWNDFSITPSEITLFRQPNETSIVLNRVMGTAESLIQGTLKANGQVLLINQNGILVGKEAFIDTGSFLASSLDLIDSENWRFKGDSHAAVVNEGTILARNGDAVLLGYRVENSGLLDARMGSALLGAAEDLWIQPKGHEKLFIRMSQGQKEGTGIENSGWIEAARAELKADGNLYSLALKHSGEIDAFGVLETDGQIFLIAEEGVCHISGSINASKEKSGGAVFVDAEYTYIDADATIQADAGLEGDGGKLVAWGQKGLIMHGAASARGGQKSGNGGFVEISSHGGMDFGWNVDVSANHGESGNLLLDPTTVTISTMGPFTPVTFMDMPPTSWAALTNPVNIDSMALGTFLDMSGNVTISTNILPDPGAVGTITVINGFSWTSGNKLTLIGDSSITVLDSITSTSLAVPSTQVVIDLQAPTIAIGDSAHMAVTSPLDVIVLSGAVIMNGSSSISIYGGTAGNRTSMQAPHFDLSGGAFTMEAGTGAGAGTAIFAFESLTGIFTGNIMMDGLGGGAIITGEPTMMPMVPPPITVFISTPGNMTMLGGSGSGVNVHAGALLNLAGGGDLQLLLGGDLIIQAGSSMDDGNSGIVNPFGGTFNISARDITLTSGTVGSPATNFLFFGIFGGNMSVTSTGPNGIVSHGGTADGCSVIFAAGAALTVTAPSIQLIGGTAPNTESIIGAGLQMTMNIAGDVNLTSQPFVGGGFAAIGNFGPAIQMDLNIGGDINLNAFGSDVFIAASGAGPHTLNIDAMNLTIASFSDGNAYVATDDGTLNCNIFGNCTFTGGTTSPAMGNSFVGIVGATTAGLVANLNVTASHFLINGGSANGCHAGIALGDPAIGGGGGGEIHVTATGSSGIILNGGTANNTPAVIEIIGTAATNAIFFDATHSSGHVTLNGSVVGGLTNAGARIQTSTGSIIDPVGSSIILNGTMSGPAIISVGPGPAAPLLLQAGVNIELRSSFSSIQNLSAGDLTLVVDADFPEPFLGPGALLMASGSTILTTGGALRIFTSQQPFNQILGTLNGFSFTAGPIFVDSAQEIWGVYYPSLLGGFPFTVFYKNILQLLTQQAATVASELATGLHPFNEFPGWVARFTISAADFTQPYYLRRRQLNLFDHPKTWTYLMPE